MLFPLFEEAYWMMSRRQRFLAGCNYRYPGRRRPPQGEKEKARRRRQREKGMLSW